MSSQPLPIVVTVGFAGARNLLPAGSHLKPGQVAAFHAAIQQQLEESLSKLPADLKLSPHHFLCGVSQIAIGGDCLFTRACAALPLAQRIFLPQTRDEYLAAKSPKGTPDFTAEEKAAALSLLASPHIIHEQVVSGSSNRDSRFQDTNLEILRASDAVVCLLRSDSDDKPGGTRELMKYAIALGKPVLEITVSLENSEAKLERRWHPAADWSAPKLITGLEDGVLVKEKAAPTPGIPVHASDFLRALKDHGSSRAEKKQRGFRNTAVKVIGAHLFATVCAVAALTLPVEAGPTLLWLLLIVELIFLTAGFMIHRALHDSKTPQAWATYRLTAEIARSVGALHEMHLDLGYLFSLPLPRAIRPLLRTINVLHLAATKNSTVPWTDKLTTYLQKRLDGKNGQIHYFTTSLAKAESRKSLATFTFYAATVCAFLATTAKLWLVFADHGHGGSHTIPHLLGALAILLPIVAVGALSLAAAFDLEARVHTFRDTLDFLKINRPLYQHLSSERAFIHLVLETETSLLGEITNWASRRSFTSIT